MKKVSLRIDQIRVDSFTTAEQSDRKGTVRAAEDTEDTAPKVCLSEASCGSPTCDPTCSGFITYPAPGSPCVIC